MEENKVKVKVKRKLSFKGLIVVLLFVYLLAMLAYFLYSMPIKTIIIKGNNLTSDQEIINAANLNKNKKIFALNTGQARKKIENLALISEARINKNLWGKLTIKVTEEKILFYYQPEAKYVLSDGTRVNLDKPLGVPTLNNFVATDTLKEFIKHLKDIDPDILSLVSEMVYDPDIKDDITLDDGRFFFKMNDENSVYINIVNMEKLNNYHKFIASLSDTRKGILYLDSSLNSTIFTTYDKIKAEKEQAEQEEAENKENEEEPDEN